MLNDGLRELRKCALETSFQLLPGEAECILHEITRLRKIEQLNSVEEQEHGLNRNH